MYNHNKAQQSKNRVHISWDILYGQKYDTFTVTIVLVKAKMLKLRCNTPTTGLTNIDNEIDQLSVGLVQWNVHDAWKHAFSY